MPIVVRIEHAVPTFEKWKQAFDADPANRKRSGVRRYRILRQHDDPGFVMIDLEFDALSEAEAFLDTMRRIWGGAGRAVVAGPRARIAEVVEATEL